MSSYILRLSVKPLIKAPIDGLEIEPTIGVGSILVTVKQRGVYLVLQARDFESEAEAEAFLPKLKGGLWNLALEHNIAFISCFERRSITRAQDPYEAAKNLAKNFGIPVEEPVQPLHGLSEEDGYTIYRADENLRFLGMGDATVSVSTGWANVAKTLATGIEQVRQCTDGADSQLMTAVDLYLSHFYETSIRARFLTLMMVLEVLAPVTEKHVAAVQLLSDLQRTIDLKLATEVDPEIRDAMESLRRETEFRKETSIRRRIRRLVLDKVPLVPEEREALAKKVIAAYDLRGSVVHSGAVDSEALAAANETAMLIVKLLLQGLLGLTEMAQYL